MTNAIRFGIIARTVRKIWGAMSPFALFFSPFGRLSSRPFVLAVVVVYGVSFLSQALLAAPMTARASLLPFALAQAVVAWSWFALHAKRLRDAGDGIAFALAIAILYALAVVLLLLFIQVIAGTAGGSTRNDFGAGGIVSLIVVVSVIAEFAGDTNLGAFYFFLLALLVLISVPVVLALGVSVWAARRPTADPPRTDVLPSDMPPKPPAGR
jgi:uncharacterized membrane protein YhaH (DUF805 family)